MAVRLVILFNIIAFFVSAALYADENIEDDLGGFFEESVAEDTLTEMQLHVEEKSSYSVSGDLSFKTSAGYKQHEVDGVEYSGFNQARTSLYLQLDAKLSDEWKMRASTSMFYDAIYDIYSHNDYRSRVEDRYKRELRLDETYIQGRVTPEIDLKLGRQVVVWGKSDTIRVTDIINPLDNRLLVMTDIEDLRLSVGMAKLDYYFDAWNLSAMLIPESRIMIEATPRGEFFPVDNVFALAPDPFLELKEPSSSFGDMQYALALNGIFSGWDLSFYAAHVLDQKWHFNYTQGSAPLSEIKRVVSKIDMLGYSVNIAYGNWLLKSEAAYLGGVKYNSTADEKNRLDLLIGFDYMGFRDTVISVEVVNRHIYDYEGQMKQQADYVDRDEMQTAVRVNRTFMNETLDLTALVSMFGSNFEDGGFARVWVEYEVMDALSVNLGVVDYIGGDKPQIDSIRENDRVFADITYSF